ncbi:nitrate reductase molybdenum cofactor assembly chaperone [Sulfolobus islandicus M.14.25]|uniref:Nitrate reductase molybdenum cofactor assembly chaperone n=1 Tax=Saccharolobus islandicus (strain M.14.25 / Kamchatka \|nr:nitrate reductase molybdenum cofactor assembly chaperone [Sulfolobus islandicus]ACP37635.1 nitrate reductase molybdenum cofactor assembly chaperone [Sulfolobus islandicus M.14.25]
MNRELLVIIADLLEYPAYWLPKLSEFEAKLVKINDPFVVEFIKEVKSIEPIDLEEIYVSTFDFNKETTLNITYYYTGDEKQRGNNKRGILLLKLKELANINTKKELPDYLPNLIRFIANNANENTKEILELIKLPLKELTINLKAKNSIFYYILVSLYKELYLGDPDV